MKKIFNIFLVISFFFLTSLYAIIEEISTLAVLKDLQPGTVVALDLDNNLVMPSNNEGLGGDAWCSKMIEKGYPFSSVLALYFKLQEYVSLQLIDPAAVDIIADLKKQGIIVIGLTSRSSNIAQRTLDELSRLGIEFSSLVVDFAGKLNQKAFFAKGVAFCEQNSKGAVLVEILQQTGIHPTNVVAMDDKKKYLEQIEIALGTKIPFCGYRNSVLDKHVAEFDIERANSHLLELGFSLL